MSPSSALSSTLVIVTDCGVFQFAAVKVSDDVEIVPSATFELLTPMITSALGWVLRRTENVACPAASVVISPDVGVTVIPGVSLSALVTVRSAGFSALYFG